MEEYGCIKESVPLYTSLGLKKIFDITLLGCCVCNYIASIVNSIFQADFVIR